MITTAIHGILSQNTGPLTPFAAFKARVLEEGGTMANESYTQAAFNFLESHNLLTFLSSWPSINFAYKKNSSGLISKIYCLQGKDQLQDTPENQPIYSGNVINGKAVVVHAQNKFLKADSSTGMLGIVGNSSRHEIALFKQLSPQVNVNLMGWDASGSQEGNRGWDTLMHSGKVALHTISGDTIADSPAYAADTWSLFERSYDGTTVKASINKGTRSAASFSTNTYNAPLKWGSGSYVEGDYYTNLNAHLTDIAVFAAELSDASRSAMLSFMVTHYNLGI